MENKHIPPLLIDEISRLKKLAQLIEANLKSIYLDINIIETTLVNTNDDIHSADFHPSLNHSSWVDLFYNLLMNPYFSTNTRQEIFESVTTFIDNITIAFESMQTSIKEQKLNLKTIKHLHEKKIEFIKEEKTLKRIKNLELITSRALVDCTELKSEIHFISNTPEVI